MKDVIIPVIAAALGSSALFSFLQFLINRRDRRKDDRAHIVAKLDKLSQAVDALALESCRVQILTLIHTAPRNAADILTLARHYFVDLNGDTYVSRVFSDWLAEQDIAAPEWYKPHN